MGGITDGGTFWAVMQYGCNVLASMIGMTWDFTQKPFDERSHKYDCGPDAQNTKYIDVVGQGPRTDLLL